MRSQLEALGVEHLVEQLRQLFALAAELPQEREAARESRSLLEGKNGELLKGLVYAVATLEPRDAAPLVSALEALCSSMSTKIPGLGQRCAKVTNACIAVLAQLAAESASATHDASDRASNEAAAALQRLQWSASYAQTKRLLDEALTTVCQAWGVDLETLRAQLASRTATADANGGVDERDERDKAVRETLVRAEHHLDAGAEARALDTLLEAWRALPAPELALLILALSSRLDKARPSLRERTQKRTLERFCAAAETASPTELGRLLEVVPVGSWQGTLQQVALLARFDRDPRVAAVLTELVAKPPYTSNASVKLWQRVFDELLRIADPRTLQRLAPLVEDYSERFVDGYKARDWVGPKFALLVQQLTARCGAGQPALEGEALASWRRLHGRLCGRRSEAIAGAEANELLEQIYAAPDDDQLRAVYADRLTELGDPRGELIVLQLQKEREPLSRKQQARERELIGKWGREWLGELDPALLKGDLEYRRGFPAAGRVELRGERAAEQLIGHPGWSTFESIELRYPWHGDELITHPVFRGLRELRGSGCGLAVRLCHADPPRALRLLQLEAWYTRHEGFSTGFHGDLGGRELPEALRQAPGLPQLETLWFGVHAGPAGQRPGLDALRWLLGSPLGARLKRLILTVHWNHFAPWLVELAEHRAELTLPELQLRSAASGLDAFAGWPLTVRPAERALDADLRQVKNTELKVELSRLRRALQSLCDSAQSPTRDDHRGTFRTLRVRLAPRAKPDPHQLKALHGAADLLHLEHRDLPELR
jgi:uncharacterized protein (TIGR02996 family)